MTTLAPTPDAGDAPTAETVASPAAAPPAPVRRTHVRGVGPLADDARPDDTRPEARRMLTGTRISDALALVGAGVAALALTAVVATQLAPVRGPAALVALAVVAFVVLYGTVVALDGDGPAVRDRLVQVAVHGLAFAVLATLVFVVVFTVARGATALGHPNFLREDMSLAGPLDPLTVGGVQHAVVGSLIQIGIALAITVPLGLTAAVCLTELPGRWSRFVRTVVEAMTALPSIVAGLFVYATAILTFGLDKSGLAAALAISIMMLPIMIRSADVVLRLVPLTLKEASYALGAGQWRTVRTVVLPTSRSGLTTAIILATARGIGETSPVLLTSGFTASLNTDPLHGPMVSLPLAIFQFVKSPEPAMVARGFGAATVLMGLVVILFAAARWVGTRDAATRARAADRREAVRDRLRAGWAAGRGAVRSAWSVTQGTTPTDSPDRATPGAPEHPLEQQ